MNYGFEDTEPPRSLGMAEYAHYKGPVYRFAAFMLLAAAITSAALPIEAIVIPGVKNQAAPTVDLQRH